MKEKIIEIIGFEIETERAEKMAEQIIELFKERNILTFADIMFKDRIISGIKVHTIRRDKQNRFKVGNIIHFWLGELSDKKWKITPYKFGIGYVSRIEIIEMKFAVPEENQTDIVYIGDDIILKSEDELYALAKNDGFDDWDDMKRWFNNSEKQYIGKIIFWKNFIKC